MLAHHGDTWLELQHGSKRLGVTGNSPQAFWWQEQASQWSRGGWEGCGVCLALGWGKGRGEDKGEGLRIGLRVSKCVCMCVCVCVHASVHVHASVCVHVCVQAGITMRLLTMLTAS